MNSRPRSCSPRPGYRSRAVGWSPIPTTPPRQPPTLARPSSRPRPTPADAARPASSSSPSRPSRPRRYAAGMLGQTFKGFVISRLLVEEAVDIAAEYYLAITVDREPKSPIMICSAKGGVDIEEVAESDPEAIVTPGHRRRLRPARLRATRPRRAGRPRPEGRAPVRRHRQEALQRLRQERRLARRDQPADGHRRRPGHRRRRQVRRRRQRPLPPRGAARLQEEAEEDPIEAEAHRQGVTYVRLPGDIGIMGNGAGIVMGTLDMVTREGGAPANFCDIGGGASAETVRKCLAIVLMNPNVKGVLINVFGGITRGDAVARGILEATDTMDIKVPIVVRMAGTRPRPGSSCSKGRRWCRSRIRSRRPARSSRWRRERRRMGILVGKDTRLVVQGITGAKAAPTPTRCSSTARNIVAGVTPGRGGQKFADSVPVYDSVAEAVEKDGANTQHHLRAAAVRRRRHGRGRCRRHRARHLHHRGRPRHRHRPGRPLHRGARRHLPPDRPELPRRHDARRGPASGSCRRTSSSAATSASISRSGTLTYEVVDLITKAGHGRLDLHRRRRRPGHRHDLRRRAGDVRQRRADREGAPDRRDRRRPTRRPPPPTSRTTSRSRSSASSPAARRRPASGWATPARSSLAIRARPRRRLPPSRRPASMSTTPSPTWSSGKAPRPVTPVGAMAGLHAERSEAAPSPSPKGRPASVAWPASGDHRLGVRAHPGAPSPGGAPDLRGLHGRGALRPRGLLHASASSRRGRRRLLHLA